ncbi:MAG: ABC transporter permease [Nitrospirae bacterium]|nr:ABC transporter permease [Nitrospirota bacterium]
MKNALRGAFFIALKDMKAYYFKPPNISWGILFPLVFILAFYLRSPMEFSHLIPGLLALSLLFSTTSMEAIVITFERMTGALERLLLYPVSVTTILAGKISGGAGFGLSVTIIFLLGLIILFPFHLENPLLFLASVIISSFAFSALGAFVSVSVKQVFEAQTLANLFRFPMIFLSGVFIPVNSLPSIIKPIAYLMPLTYSIDSIRFSFGYQYQIMHPVLSLLVLTIFAFVLLELSAKILKGRMS